MSDPPQSPLAASSSPTTPVRRVVVVTNLWPSARRPAWGSFVANRVEALRRAGTEVELVAVRDHSSPLRRYASLAAATAWAAGRRRRRGNGDADPASGSAAVPSPGAAAGPRVHSATGPAAEGGGAVVEAHIAYPTGLFADVVARRRKLPLVLYAHGSDVLRLPDRSELDQLLCRRIFGRAALVIANSEYLADVVTDRLGFPRERLRVVPPGIRYADLAAARDLAAQDETPRGGLLFVANLIPRKGLDVLLEALARLRRDDGRDWRLRVIGDGPERERLERRARTSELSVEFAGAQPQAEVVAAMARAGIVVVPSREEALGLAALESMAAGCVTVVSGVGGLAEVTSDGGNGIVCPPEDPAALAAALRRARAVTDDPRRWDAMRRAGDAVARGHAVDAAARVTLGHYREVLDRSGPRGR